MIYPDIPIKALSIMQPWAWLIVNGNKDIENREWRTSYRGPVAIHAGKKMDTGTAHDLVEGYHPVSGDPLDFEIERDEWHLGGIVGVAEIVACVSGSESPWFVGSYGFIFTNARRVPFIPVKGALSFFDWRKNL